MRAAADDESRRAVEAWFVHRGIPHFIHDYSASRDVLTRALPLLTLVLLGEVLGAANVEWVWWANALALLGGIALLAVAVAGINVLRDRRPFARPERVGAVEVAVFVLAPSGLQLVFGGQTRAAVVTAVANAALLAAIYLGTSYGVVPMSRWAAGRLVAQLTSLVGLVVRALPLLLLFVTFFFLTAEVWQVCSELHGPFFWLTLASFLATGSVFVILRLPREIGALARLDGSDDTAALLAGTPASALPLAAGAAPALSRRQWGNVGLVVLFGQGLQITIVAVVVGMFLAAFGVVAVSEEVITSWVGRPPNVLADVQLWGRHVVVTEELLRVAGFLTAFSGLYFTVVVLTDQAYRAEFLEEVVGEVRQAFAVRAAYLGALGAA